MKKIIAGILLVSLSNLFIGCYSYKPITIQDYKRIEKEDKPDKIRVMTKDYEIYDFSDSNFYIKDDTLYSKIQSKLYNGIESIENKIALTEIIDIEIKQFDWLNTILLSLGIYLCVGLIVGIGIGISNWEK